MICLVCGEEPEKQTSTPTCAVVALASAGLPSLALPLSSCISSPAQVVLHCFIRRSLIHILHGRVLLEVHHVAVVLVAVEEVRSLLTECDTAAGRHQR